MTMAKKMKAAEEERRYIFDDIMLSIFSTLPVKSLLRFRSVSRSWNVMIEPALNQMKNNKKCSLIYIPDDKSDDNFYNVVREQPHHEIRPSNWVFPLGGGYSVIGVCEGLICLEKASIVYIWNPILNIFRIVPPPPPSSGQNPEHVFGFGFSCESNDYRVIKLVYFDERIQEIEIYSLADNSWKSIKRRLQNLSSTFWQPLSSICSGSGVFHEGFVYWLALRFGEYVLLSFDMEKERESVEFTTFVKLKQEVKDGRKPPELAVVDGFLVMFQFNLGGLGGRARVFHRRRFVNSYSTSCYMGTTHRPRRINLLPVVGDEKNKRMHMHMTTKCGHIVFEDIQDHRLFSCDCSCDGRDFVFKFRDLQIYTASSTFRIIPLVETLFFFDH